MHSYCQRLASRCFYLSIKGSLENSYRNLSECKMAKNALVILAPGAEEMEFVISTDVLRRAGVKVTVAGLCGKEPVKCSRDVIIVPDVSLESTKEQTYDVIVLPGGLAGSKAMAISPLVGELLKKQNDCNRYISAICAAPTVLAAHSIGHGKSVTSYPSVKNQLEKDYKYVEDKKVVCDGNLITSQGPGTAYDFALKLIEILIDRNQADKVAEGLLLK